MNKSPQFNISQIAAEIAAESGNGLDPDKHEIRGPITGKVAEMVSSMESGDGSEGRPHEVGGGFRRKNDREHGRVDAVYIKAPL